MIFRLLLPTKRGVISLFSGGLADRRHNQVVSKTGVHYMLAYVCSFAGAMSAHLKNLKRDRKGVAALEYGILAGGVALAIIVGVTTYGTDLGQMFTALGTKVTQLAPN